MTVTHTDPMSLPDAEFLTRARDMCGTKAAFVTRAEAVATTNRHRYPGTPYRCPWCSSYHITTYDRARAKAFTRRLSRLLRED